MKLKIKNTPIEYECYKAIKGADFVKCVDTHNQGIAYFSGVTNFDNFVLDGGNWSEPEMDKITELELAVAELAEIFMG